MSELPVFIGGFRSGSTWLINLLGLHPKVTPWFETKSLCEALRWQRVLGDPDTETFERYVLGSGQASGFDAKEVMHRMGWHMRHTAQRAAGQIASGKAAHEHYPLGSDHVLYSLDEAEKVLQCWSNTIPESPTETVVAGATGDLIRKLAALQTARTGQALWINKTPEIPRFGHELRHSLGRCRIIHLIRDGRHVAQSAMDLGWGNVERMARLWKEMIELSRAAAVAEDYLEIRYEDLNNDPATTVDRVLGFLGLDPRGASLWTNYQQRIGEMTPQNSHRKQVQLPARELETFNTVAGELLQKLEYL